MLTLLKTKIGLLGLIAALCGAYLAAGNETPEKLADLTLRCDIVSYTAKDENMLDALLALGAQEHLPMGIEYVNPKDLETPLNLKLSNATAEDVLKAILGQHKGYEWKAQEGVLAITHKSVPMGKANLLNTLLPEFFLARRETLQMASFSLRMQLERELYPITERPGITGVVGSLPVGSFKNQIGPLKMHRVTVRQALDELVRKSGEAAWVVLVPPAKLGELPTRWPHTRVDDFWRVIEYEGKPGDWSNIITPALRANWRDP